MKSITIHDIDDNLEILIQHKARKEGLSIDKTIKKILEDALMRRSEMKKKNKNDFLDLFGVWSEEDVREFDNAVKDFETINPEDWH